MIRSTIARNLSSLRKRIRDAAGRVDRDPDDVTLIVVTKSVPETMIAVLGDLEITDLGENRVQSLITRKRSSSNRFRWHMIGHLQRNKASHVVGQADRIHSVDTLRLARRIDEIATRLEIRVSIHAQINIGREESKYGVSPDDAPAFLEELSRFDHLAVQGLMTMAPRVDRPEETRPFFRRLAEISAQALDRIGPQRFGPDLSMGMSEDFEVAIEEGSTHVRIGRAVFRESEPT